MSEPDDECELYAECSDDEKYNPTGADDPLLWQPTHEDVVQLYQKLASGERLELEWKCPGRRSPSPEIKAEEMELEENIENKEEEDEKLEPTEFDFDDINAETNVVTPIRTPGSTKTPRSMQKRVARLDKILDDISRHKKLNKAKKSHSPATPGSTPLRHENISDFSKLSKTLPGSIPDKEVKETSRPSTPKSSHSNSPRMSKPLEFTDDEDFKTTSNITNKETEKTDETSVA